MDVREKLRYGDVPVLAEMAGVALSTAKKTIHGGRSNARVLEAAQLLVDSREQIKNKMNRK